ncbi:MAG: MbnP family protein [Akkermansiaceae bacterium]
MKRSEMMMTGIVRDVMQRVMRRAKVPCLAGLGLLLSQSNLAAGEIQFELQHHFDSKRLALSSLSYQTGEAGETFSVSRLSYLLSNFAFAKPDGQWLELKDQFAYIDLETRQTKFVLRDVPDGEFTAVRFSIGLDKETNHSDPAIYAAGHALNPNQNRLHWTWQDGYIFLALEGRYRKTDQGLGGFSYHFANDWNLRQIELPVKLTLQGSSAIGLRFDLQSLFQGPEPISMRALGDSTHSAEGDAIAKAMKANLAKVFSLIGVTDATPLPKVEKITPLFLPKNPKGYPFKMSAKFPKPTLPLDNPLLVGRVQLGEKLFHDKELSADGTISCASCHDQAHAFSDPRKLSIGIDGALGERHSMPLFNLAWKEKFFWDGRAGSLRDQIVSPILSPIEMGATRSSVRKLLTSKYEAELEAAFGTRYGNSQMGHLEIAALALESFVLTLTSYDSHFDQAMQGKAKLTDQERRGFELFFTEYEPRSGSYGADCFHCHGGALFTDNRFHNNGLAPTKDYGRGDATSKPSDRYKFSTPSLRNVALTAPYMHDGRFETLEEVMAHYNSGINRTENLDPNIAKHPEVGLNLSPEDIDALVAFLKSLSDPKYR